MNRLDPVQIESMLTHLTKVAQQREDYSLNKEVVLKGKVTERNGDVLTIQLLHADGTELGTEVKISAWELSLIQSEFGG